MVVSSSIGATRLGEEFPRAAKLAGNSDIAGLVRNAPVWHSITSFAVCSVGA